MNFNAKQLIRAVVRPLIRSIKPASGYSLYPISSSFGYDRGEPIDRFYIDNFLHTNSHLIKGHCLEITDPSYTNKYGSNVTKSDILDINPNNKRANIHGDLRDLKKQISKNTYDCIILTHVLGLIDDCDSVISECYRILKPGGVLIYTGSCLGPLLEKVYWRFTPNSVHYLLTKHFESSKVKIEGYGNVLVAQAFLAGLSQSDLTYSQLELNDHRFPIIITAIAEK